MALLGVGVADNLKITKVLVNNVDGKESLDVTFSEDVAPKATEEVSDLDVFNSASTSSGEAKQNNIRFYPITLADYEGNAKSGDDLVNEVFGLLDKEKGSREVTGLKAQLTHILAAYLPADQIKWNLFDGLEIKDAKDLTQKITKQAVLDKVMHNIFTQFKAMLEPVMAKEKVAVKFLRKSQQSNFPRLNARKIDWNPFIANTKDAKLKAKLKFSAYEIEKGLDSNEQSLDGADSTDADTLASQIAATNTVFLG
jgi:hypothetical protein